MIYLDLMETQVMARNGVQENKIDMMINAWKMLLQNVFCIR